MPEHILAIDQGKTSTRAIVFDSSATPVASAQVELSQHFPQPGWVEHDPIEIAETAVSVAKKAISRASLAPGDIAAIGIANQRETTIVWERSTGRPLANAIVWQDRRTAEICGDIGRGEHARDIRQITGLVVDAYFSATKLMWLLTTIPNGQQRAEAGELCFGTVDTWLLWHLTGGAVHATDATNASRTMLLNLHDLQWDPEMLNLFDVPETMLPELRGSADDFGAADKSVLGAEIPITAMPRCTGRHASGTARSSAPMAQEHLCLRTVVQRRRFNSQDPAIPDCWQHWVFRSVLKDTTPSKAQCS